jgi:hypothetical protein
MADILIFYNADPNIPNIDDEFPLHQAAKNFSASSINILRRLYQCTDVNNPELWRKILVNPSSKYQSKKVDYTALQRKLKLEDLLPEYWLMHPTINDKDAEGSSLIHLLAEIGNQWALLALGKLLNEDSNFSSTPCNEPNNIGLTPLGIALGLSASDQAVQKIKQQMIELLACHTSKENQRKAGYFPQDTQSAQIKPIVSKP